MGSHYLMPHALGRSSTKVRFDLFLVSLTPSNLVVFSDIMDAEDVPKLTIWRATKDVFDEIKKIERPLIAEVIEGDYANSPAFLERLGFRQL